MDEAKRLQKWTPIGCSSLGTENEVAVDAAITVLKNTEHTKKFGNFYGGNTTSRSISIEFENEKYLIPPQCNFYCCNVFEIKDKLKSPDQNRHDVIVLDPPWRNKHVRRKNRHSPSEG